MFDGARERVDTLADLSRLPGDEGPERVSRCAIPVLGFRPLAVLPSGHGLSVFELALPAFDEQAKPGADRNRRGRLV